MIRGDLPLLASRTTDLMQGWGSIVSAFAAVGALIFTGWLLKHEIRVRREEQADAVQAQARQVVGTLYQEYRKTTNPETGQEEGPIVGFFWRVTNYSNAPVINVTGSVTYPPGRTHATQHVIRELKTTADGTCYCDPPVVRPADFEISNASLEIEFTDSHGLKWRRTGAGEPIRVLPQLRTRRMSVHWIAIGLGTLGVLLAATALVIALT